MRVRRRWLPVVLAAALVAGVAGCGDDDDSAGGTTAAGGLDLAGAQAEIEQFRGVPEFEAPGPEVDAEATALARRLAALPQAALRRMKRVLALTAPQDLERALALETDATVAGFLDPETTRRIRSF